MLVASSWEFVVFFVASNGDFIAGLLNNCCASSIFVASDRITEIKPFKLDLTMERGVRWESSYRTSRR